MFTGQLFQLLDKYSDPIGIIYTENVKIKENTVEDLWKEFCNEFEPDADAFVERLEQTLNRREDFMKEFPTGVNFERVYTSETFAE